MKSLMIIYTKKRILSANRKSKWYVDFQLYKFKSKEIVWWHAAFDYEVHFNNENKSQTQGVSTQPKT
jgi:hypothetical protein